MAEEFTPAVSPAEFAKIPLDFVIATPLLTAIQAHKQAAHTTLEFIQDLLDKNVDFEMEVESSAGDAATGRKKKIHAPLLSIVKVPSLTFDSISVSFNYAISEVIQRKEQVDGNIQGQIGTTGILSKFINASFSGSLNSSRLSEHTVNRGGSLDVKIHASESPLPPGLEKIITALTDNINVKPAEE